MTRRTRRKVMRTFKLNEISAVDTPAQEGASIVIMKRQDSEETTKSSSEKSEPRAEDIGNQPTEDDMADKTADDQSADIKKLNDRISELEAVLALAPEHRAHYDRLPVSKRADFLTAPDADKDAALDRIEKGNPVIYTDEKGREYRKNDDARLVEMAKERDEDAKAIAKFRIEAEMAEFTKQADELIGLIPGEKVAKVAVIRSLSKIEDEEQRKAALKLLEDANKVYKMAMNTNGVMETGAPSNNLTSARGLLDAAVAKCASEDGISEPKAYEKVLATAQGQKLYDAVRAERNARASN